MALVGPICSEFRRRREHPYFAWRPDVDPARPQKQFHQSKAMIRLLFGGNQSGKSRTAAQEIAWWLCEDHPYQETEPTPRVYVISATYRTVQEGIWKHLRRILPEWLVERVGPCVANWDIPTFVRMATGAQVDFISAEGGADARKKLQAAAVNLIVIDEEVAEEIWSECQARRLKAGGRVIISATLINSEEWCCALEDRAEDNDPNVHLFRLSTYRARDCGHVDKRVVAEMEATLSEETRMVRLEGKSRRMEGLVYPGFSKLHVVDPFAIPKTWTRYCALDPGWRTFGVLWAAVSPTGQYVIYREMYEHAKHYQVIAEKIFAAEGWEYHKPSSKWVKGQNTEDIAVRWIDPSAFGRHESGEYRVGTLLAQHYEISCAPAQNDVEVGIEMCARSLMPGMDDIPKVRVFNTCRSFLKEIRGYKRIVDTSGGNQSERKDGPRKKNDHLMDCWRYLEMGGLNYDDPVNPIYKQRDFESEVEGVKVALKLSDRFTEDIRKILLKQMGKVTDTENRPHPGGIGTEY
jgi:hypothetical protein